MPPAPGIRLLESDANRRGDLFNRLMDDLFVALGYELPQRDVSKPGREVDLSADHRLEGRRAVGECKATRDPIGGSDLNKFVGVMSAERGPGKSPPVTGYFVSLGGFTATAIQQENDRVKPKVVLLDAAGVVAEMVKGRALVPCERATEVAGRFRAGLDHLELDPEAELLAHERGWAWAVYYTTGKKRTDFVLVHGDGTPLARAVADEVVAADKSVEGTLHTLTCRNPAPPHSGAGQKAAVAAYAKYLADECGVILLDGLPADGEVGTRKMRLENLFVPLSLVMSNRRRDEPQRRSVGAVLAEHPRLAILAAPGGGKSTLLKRLAVAYADPARRPAAAADLPARDWFPLFIRCRELRDLARGSFADLLDYLSNREGVRAHAAGFRAYADSALLDGRALLLVDGLDELSDPGDRAAFVSTLRSALQAYPGTALVVTSREAGSATSRPTWPRSAPTPPSRPSTRTTSAGCASRGTGRWSTTRRR